MPSHSGSGRKAIGLREKKGSFVSFLKVSLTVLSCLVFSSWVLFKHPREGGKGEFQESWGGKESGL